MDDSLPDLKALSHSKIGSLHGERKIECGHIVVHEFVTYGQLFLYRVLHSCMGK